ncbi:alcohol dehydrogenase catalytic domain-containing protein [Microbacterium sp. CCNWLW134]|uniref:alcohol dehydrogenase catalytic domain-containing protein n=1 Tax=Microbacterium sp. CCNWLW134 TaxID=3122064 RepID=UPI00300FCD39
MRAVLIHAVRGMPTVTDVAEPAAPEGGVVVDVRATGLCRSDWHAWAGHDEIAFPHVPGHELAGVVSEVGSGVACFRVGDRVTVPFVCGCGVCEWCRAGDAQVCPDQQQPGFTHWGSFAERVALHAADTNLVALPDAVSFEAAAALGCRFATAFRALTARARVAPGEWVTVVGAGGVGLSIVMIAVALGARVIAIDTNPRALAVASRLGAAHVVVGGADAPPVPDVVRELTGGGSHVSVDAVGSAQTAADAVLSLRRRGRHVQIGLLPTDDGRSPVAMARAIAWELDILGSHGMAAADYPGMMELVAAGRLRPQDLIERVIGLDEASALLPRFDTAAPAGMTMIDPHLVLP